MEAKVWAGFEADYSQQSDECYVQKEGDTERIMGNAETEYQQHDEYFVQRHEIRTKLKMLG